MRIINIVIGIISLIIIGSYILSILGGAGERPPEVPVEQSKVNYSGNAGYGKTASDGNLTVKVVNLRYSDEFKGRNGVYRPSPEKRFAILYVETKGAREPSFELVDANKKTYQLDHISKNEYFLIFEIPKSAVGWLKLSVRLDGRQWAVFDLSDY